MRIEYLPQEPPLQDALTVLETIFRSDSPQMRLLRTYEQVTPRLEADPDDAKAHTALHTLTAEMDRTDGWAAEANAKSILTRLGVTNFDDRVGTLSGGQRKRVALARALIDRADLLVLDEPTNHIDAATVAWLEEYLATTPGALLMVTHDRYFLDRVVNRIVELDRRQLVSYAGNYTYFLEARAARHERLADAEAKRRNLLRRELEWLRRQPMARGTKQKARKQRVEEMMQIEHDSGAGRVAMALAWPGGWAKSAHRAEAGQALWRAAVLNGLDLHLEPGDRIGIIGPNGAGKSTLLEILAGQAGARCGSLRWGETVQIGYYDQRSVDLKDESAAAGIYRGRSAAHPHQRGRPRRSRADAGVVSLSPPDAICAHRQSQRRRTAAALFAAHPDPPAQRAAARRTDQRSRHRDPGCAGRISRPLHRRA